MQSGLLKAISKRRYSAQSIPQLGLFKLPHCVNEPMQPYAPGSKQRVALQSALNEMKAHILTEGPYEVPLVVSGEAINTKGKQIPYIDVQMQVLPTEHGTGLCKFSMASKEIIEKAIEKALKVKPEWEAMPFNDRAAIFLKAVITQLNLGRLDFYEIPIQNHGSYHAWTRQKRMAGRD